MAAESSGVPTEETNGNWTSEDERSQLLEEQKAYDRAALEAERLRRTRAAVDSAWQSLE